ncbi:MAG: rhodanese-like domain-containing protein [Pseudomonadota bacterium]
MAPHTLAIPRTVMFLTATDEGLMIESNDNSSGFQNVTPAEAAGLLSGQSPPTVLDVRAPEEFATGHVPGAQNVSFADPGFEGSLENLPKDVSYLVHCQAGGRSSKALKVLLALGFSNVFHLPSGFEGWRKAGLAVEQGNPS